MSRVQGFLKFLWDFIVGDDWRIAVAVAIALVLTLVLSDDGVSSWWLLPAVVIVMLGVSVWGAVRNRG
ncbi:MAG TPA: hypothetical protein VHV75_12385 [Solirubrobacteraceae bacterium]|jgi:hypothetical protein|nr:hypothetical protein [Solirubrobacteraceae bacterium]